MNIEANLDVGSHIRTQESYQSKDKDNPSAGSDGVSWEEMVWSNQIILSDPIVPTGSQLKKKTI